MSQRSNELTQVELVLPEHANHYGTLFAANGLALLGKMAYLVAARFSGQNMVMVSADRIEFVKPVPVGTLLSVTATVTGVGRTSLTARVAARFDGAADEALRGEFKLVAVDRDGRPVRIAATLPA